MASLSLVALAVLYLLSGGIGIGVHVANAAQCMPDPTNPCKARCNGTVFDISRLFDYP